jgi:hypothetical protein
VHVCVCVCVRACVRARALHLRDANQPLHCSPHTCSACMASSLDALLTALSHVCCSRASFSEFERALWMFLRWARVQSRFMLFSASICDCMSAIFVCRSRMMME